MTTAPALLPQHAALIRASAISEAVAAERGYFSATTIYDLKRYGFGEAQCRLPALGIPIWGVDRAIALYQARPDTPRTDERGRPVKYETPRKASMALDVPPRAHRALGDPATELWITEGVRKADAAVSHRLCCLSLLGVFNFRGKNADGGITALADWEWIALNGRVVYLAFDSDVTRNPRVRAALARLKAFLERRGARVRVVYLPEGPGGAKVGLDDFLAAGHTADELRALATDALPAREEAPPPRPSRSTSSPRRSGATWPTAPRRWGSRPT